MPRIFSLLITILNFLSVSSCPTQEDLYPCICEPSGVGDIVTCSNLENYNILRNAVHAINHVKIFSFVIHNGSFMYLPHDIFKSFRLFQVEMKSTSFVALTDTDTAFEGLENELESLVMKDCQVLSDWDWSVLRKLTKLGKLNFDVNLGVISEDIQQINASSLMLVNFDNNKISHIYDSAFAAFKRVVHLSLKNNFISEVKRSMFPRPAEMLTVLELSNNRIQLLPPDMFDDMQLGSLNLDSNMIVTLNEQTFSKVWQQLSYVDLTNNRLSCDCRLSWMLDLKFPRTTKAFCDMPFGLKGKNLKDLTKFDLWC